MASNTAYLVSHTHWDREWYLPLGAFRVKLAEVVAKVLDLLEGKGEFRHFVLDGQTIALEDYLELRPFDAERIARLAKRGALSLGPWYVLADEILVSGEATVRNLMLGHELAARFGEAQKVGYAPDAFGHIAQMPQILRKAGIDSFIYSRGDGSELDDTGLEYRWRAPDGSEVLAIHQWKGYCNGGALGFEELWHAHTQRAVSLERARAQVSELLEEMGQRSRSRVLLINNGCDHLPPQQDFERILRSLRQSMPETEFRHGSFADFLAAARHDLKERQSDLSVRQGELIEGRHHLILSGVWSTRMYLKQLNGRCQRLLENTLEPLCAYLHFRHGCDYPAGALEAAWKKLLQNHPHDSICGCSIDEVHEAMESRFREVIDSAQELLRVQLEAIAPTFARHRADDRHTALCVLNSLPRRRGAVIERMVVFQPPGLAAERLAVVDEQGRELPTEVIRSEQVERFWGVDYRRRLSSETQELGFAPYRAHFAERIFRPASEQATSDQYVLLRFYAESLPACGHANFFVHEGARELPLDLGEEAVRVDGNTMENSLLRVVLWPNGTFDLEDKRGGLHCRGLNLLEDCADVGDEYDFSPCPGAGTLTTESVRGEVCVVSASALRAEMEVAFEWQLPASLSNDRSKRSEQTVACRVSVRVRMDYRCPWLSVTTEFENRAQDHRVRARFPTPIRTHCLLSDSQFYLSERPLVRTAFGQEDWSQPSPETYPQQRFSLIRDERNGLAVVNQGLPEIAGAQGQDGSALLLTLLRSVGWLSRDDFASRKCKSAGPTLYTPGAQCLRKMSFRYALAPVHGSAEGVQAMQSRASDVALRYLTPVVVVQGVQDGLRAGAELVSKASEDTVLSAIKKTQDRDSLILRLYNLRAHALTERLRFGAAPTAVFRCSLLEQREQQLSFQANGQVALELGAHEILTLEVVF
ncbi:MAG: glycosyl hydrolase-related protein [Proteobacteria bacterium]|nr:glycosyl hydrolase-related protein [Pseudomonadota bacterium]